MSEKVVGLENYVNKKVRMAEKVYRRKSIKTSKNRKGLEDATRILDGWGVLYEMKSKFHIKIDNVNFYPGKGTIYVDGDFEKLKEHGVKALRSVLEEYNIL